MKVTGAAAPSIYEHVYDAVRPELFLKAPAWRAVGPLEAIGVRADSAWDVPEPELAIVATTEFEIAGFMIANDVSSRSIEGENPLYLRRPRSTTGRAPSGRPSCPHLRSGCRSTSAS